MEFNYDDRHVFSEFEDPERKRLIAKIHNLHPEVAQVPRAIIYPLWFADMKVLQKLVATGEDKDAIYDKLGNPRLYNVPLIWGCPGRANIPGGAEGIGRHDDDLDDNGPSAMTLRDVKLQVRQRDSFKCQLTGRGILGTATAYIIPSALQNQKDDLLEKEGVWLFLENFWGKEKVSKWKDLLLQGSIINAYQILNLMKLDLQVYRYWAFSLLALRPISVNQDQTEMQIALHWLPLQKELGNINQKDKVSILQNPFQDPKYRPVKTPGDNYFVFADEDGKSALISSGHIFTVRTDNKVKRPLPSFDLLELRWHLSRIAAFQGAGDNEETDYGYYCKFDPESGPESGPESECDRESDCDMNEFF